MMVQLVQGPPFGNHYYNDVWGLKANERGGEGEGEGEGEEEGEGEGEVFWGRRQQIKVNSDTSLHPDT